MKKHIAAALALSTFAFLCSPAQAASPQGKDRREVASEQGSDEMITERDLMTLVQVLGHISGDYVDQIPKKDFMRLAIDGILSKLDAHTSYMDKDEFKKFNEEMQQDYAGIGVTITLPTKGAKGLLVEEIFPGGPAEKAGIKTGDLIVSSNGKPLSGTLDENVKLVRGPAGTHVKLEIERQGRKITISSGRSKVATPSVFGSFCECSGANAYFLRISAFHYETGRETAAALADAAKFKPSSIIVDLRDNPGGSLPASVEAASLFLPADSIVVSARERGSPERFMGAFTPEGARRFMLKGAVAEGLEPGFAKVRSDLLRAWPELAKIPVYAMVNAGSASASEIVAAALRDNGRAVVVGEKTFGKGSVQTVAKLPNGGALRLTIARYYTPSGKSIQALGVEPDVAISDDRPWRMDAIARSKARHAEKAPETFLREADLPRHLGDSYSSLDELTAKAEREIAEQLDDSRPKANEPYERRFSYAPMGSNGKPDTVTAKALELSQVRFSPKKPTALLMR